MIDSALIEHAHSIKIEDEIARRGIRLQGRVERTGPCPVCGGIDRFSINTKKQIFNCRGCAKGGDVIALVMHVDDIEFRDAVELLACAGPRESIYNPVLANTAHAQLLPDDAKQLWADRIWREAVPIIGTSGEQYLIGRGININDVPEQGGLRFHPRCPWESQTLPVVIARFTEVLTNEPRGIWRRPIDGQKPKSLGGMGGSCIRLWPDDCVEQGLVIGEGVETVLSAASRVHRGTLLQPAWACASAGNLGAFPVLSGISGLTIIADNDANGAGQSHAQECARRWVDAGVEVEILIPETTGQDFNDLGRPQ